MKRIVGLLATFLLPALAAQGQVLSTAAQPQAGKAALAQIQVTPPGGTGQAQTGQAVPLPARPGPVNQSITVPAGNGVLLKLPQPAATVMSADPTVARVQPASPTSLFLMGVEAGRTTVIATGDTGEAIVQYDVTVTPGRPGAAAAAAAAPAAVGISAETAAAIQAMIRRTLSGAASVEVRAAGGEVIITGTVPNALAAQQVAAIARAYIGEKGGVVDHLTVLSSIQVNVRVRIAEISRTLTQQLGFNWQVLGANGLRFGFLTGQAAAGPISALFPLNVLPLPPAPVPNQLGAGYSSRHWDINGVIDALASNQLISILAEPNLTAQSGETASFLAGGEFPIPVAGNVVNGGITITVEFKTFGVSLAVVPTVLSPTRLNLRVRPEVSQLSTQGAVNLPLAGGTLTIPALTVRRAETTIELGSGQSFSIAGLLEKTSNETINGVPFLGEIPVLGRMFKSNGFQRGETELVIIVTPYLVQPASNPADIRAPAGDFRPATDLDRILFDRELAPFSYLHNRPRLDAGFILK